MWATMAQMPMPEIPKTSDVSGWFGWVVTCLFLVIACALTYLVTDGRKREKTAGDALDKLIDTLERTSSLAEGRYQQAWVEHQKDREAFMHRQEAMNSALTQVVEKTDSTRKALDGLREEIRRRGGDHGG